MGLYGNFSQFSSILFTTRSTYMVNVGRFFFSAAFHSYATSWDQNLLHKRSPAEIFFSFHAASWNSAKFPDTPPYRSTTDFFFISRHLVAQGEISRHTALSVHDRFFLHATSWHREKFSDTPLYRSSTDFPFPF